MRTVKVGLVGCGTVGGGCVRIFNIHREDIKRHQGVNIELAKVAEPVRERALALGVPEDRVVADYHEILEDPEIDIVIELIGGTGIAAKVELEALAAGKNLVTANKAIMASRGKEIFDAAKAAGVEVAFEASVGGGIPIIQPLKHALTGNRIDSVMGILNGTTNYMLTRIGDGLSYDEALKEAQQKGFAEADPTADVDGHDAAAKIAILASIAFNSRVTIDDVHTEGIRSLKPVDLEFANQMGYAIKLVGIANCSDGIDIRVHPTMLPKDHPLASVNGVYNAIFAHGDSVGNVMFFGEGAGSGAAASAVMGDVIEVARHITNGLPPIDGCTCTDEIGFKDMGDLVTKYYMRITAQDRSGVLARISDCFGDRDVSIRSMVQKPADDGRAELIFMTHEAKEADVQAALENVKQLDTVIEIGTLIRIEENA